MGAPGHVLTAIAPQFIMAPETAIRRARGLCTSRVPLNVQLDTDPAARTGGHDPRCGGGRMPDAEERPAISEAPMKVTVWYDYI